MSSTPPDESLKPSSRAIRYGAAIAIVVIGILCGAIIPGTLGGTICTALVGIGLVGVVSLVFYDVGLTEDRDRGRERERAERRRLDGRGRPGTEPGRRSDGRPGGGHPRSRPTRIRDEHGRLN